MRKTNILILTLAILLVVQAGAYAIDKDNIIALSEAGASDETIITHVKIQLCNPLDESEINELEKADVSSEVVTFIKDYQEDIPAYCKHSESYRTMEKIKNEVHEDYIEDYN